MTKTDRYYPCDNCKIKQKIGFFRCPMEKKSMCYIYKLYDTITDMEHEPTFEEDFTEIVTNVLRAHGYIGEIRKTEIVNI